MCIENTCVVAASIRSCSRCQANPALALVLIPSSQESAHASPLSPGSMWSEKPASLTPIMYNIIIIYYNIMWDMRTGAVRGVDIPHGQDVSPHATEEIKWRA
jgi:hypothetical protein